MATSPTEALDGATAAPAETADTLPAGDAPATATVEAMTSDAVALGPEDALANFAVRVRRPLDEFVAWRLAELRRHGVRVSKAELTEMLLWELTRHDVAPLAERLAAFRHAAPRAPR